MTNYLAGEAEPRLLLLPRSLAAEVERQAEAENRSFDAALVALLAVGLPVLLAEVLRRWAGS